MSIFVDPSAWALHTSSGVAYKLKDGYPKASIGKDDLSITEVVIIRTADLALFLHDTFPHLEYSGSGWNVIPGRECPGFAGIQARQTQIEPFIPGKPWMYGSTDFDTYSEFLEIQVSYKGKEPDEGGSVQSLLEVDVDCGIDSLMIPNNIGVKLISSKAITNTRKGQKVKDASYVPSDSAQIPAVRCVPVAQWSVSYPQMPWSILPNLLFFYRPMLGCVNSTTMSLFGNAQAETVLFLSMNIHKTFSLNEQGKFEASLSLDLKFAEKHIGPNIDSTITTGSGGTYTAKGHNHVFSPMTNTFDRILIDGEDMYKQVNLNLLWT